MSENINNVNYDTECSEDYRVSNMKKDIIVQRLKDRAKLHTTEIIHLQTAPAASA